jgi:hypothetical protein
MAQVDCDVFLCEYEEGALRLFGIMTLTLAVSMEINNDVKRIATCFIQFSSEYFWGLQQCRGTVPVTTRD